MFPLDTSSLRLAAQQPEIQPLPIDPKIRYGQLNNGLTYYIRHNAQPKDRADFFIAQNVGSILEDENQRGLAHFLEHMAFDGTKNFPGHGMDEFTESIGMRGGENFNAYTSFDETVYMIMNAPVTRESIVDSCLLILHDWSGFITLADTAIEKERGVIREEWRTRQDAQARIWEQQLPKMFPDNKYAYRMPIGTIDVINNFKPDELRDYYKKWYRPDLQGIIIVGDIDVDKVEAAVKRIFADIPAPVNPAKRNIRKWRTMINRLFPLLRTRRLPIWSFPYSISTTRCRKSCMPPPPVDEGLYGECRRNDDKRTLCRDDAKSGSSLCRRPGFGWRFHDCQDKRRFHGCRPGKGR